MISFKDCPLCWQRKIHVSLNACEQCEWAASFARDVDKAQQELAQVKAERDALREFVEDEAERDCCYGDNCPSNAGTRHGTCTACKARAVLRRLA